ncbi:hypothetical protein J437_LFUL005399, partial [Ladona fulva]
MLFGTSFVKLIQIRRSAISAKEYTPGKGHLKALQRDKYEELLRPEKEPRLATERDPKTQLEKAKKQVLSHDILSKNKKWDASYSKSKEIDKLISEMIALEDLPFIFVESLGFRRFM